MDHAQKHGTEDAAERRHFTEGPHGGGGHLPQHHQAAMKDRSHHSRESRDGGGAPTTTQPQPQSSAHKYSSNDAHRARPSRSSADGAGPMMPRTKKLDPTGMFRNRGRRVIAGSRSNHNGAGMSASPPKNYRMRRNPDLPPVMNGQSNNLDGQPQGLTQAQQNRRTRQSQIDSQSKHSEDLIQFEPVSTQQLQQAYPLRPSKKTLIQQLHDNSTDMAGSEGAGDRLNHVERIMKRAEPEMDRPPQSSLMHDFFNAPSSGDRTTQSDGNEPLAHGHKNNHSDENSVGSDHTRSTVGSTVSIMGSAVGEGGDLRDDDARLLAVKRRMMRDVEEVLEEEGESDEEGERSDDDGNGNFNDNGVDNCVDNENDEVEDSKTSTNQQHKNEETANTDGAIHDSNNDTLNISLEVSFHNDTSFVDDRAVNTSMLDDRMVNTSFFSDHPLNASLLDDHPMNASLLDDHIVNDAIPEGGEKAAAFFDEHPVNASFFDEQTEQKGNEALPRKGEEANNKTIKNENGRRNVMKVADFSNARSADADTQTSLNNHRGESVHGDSSPTKNPGQESPFRAAFRRSAGGSSLPPLSSAESLRRLTPKKFAGAASGAASLLVGQCFSFEDTTLDDDDFLVGPDGPHYARSPGKAGGAGGGGGGRYHTATNTHKYYGLSAVASHDESDLAGNLRMKGPRADARNVPKWQRHPPLHRARPSRPASPFRVIRHSQTWDHHGRGSPFRRPTNSYNGDENPSHLNGDIRQTSSFDHWSSPAAGWRRGPPSGDDVSGRPFRINESSRSISVEAEIDGLEGRDIAKKDWKKIETERGDAIGLLACMVEQSLNFDPMQNEGSKEILCEKCRRRWDDEPNSRSITCEDCLEKMKLIANAVKDVSADLTANEQSPAFEDQLRSSAIDTLVRSHEFVLELKRSSLSAKKWLDSVGQTKNDSISLETDDRSNQSPDVVALRARLHSAENAISSKRDEFERLNEELSKCRAEIGRLKSSSRTQSQPEPMSMSTHKSMLSSSSSDDDSAETSAERGGPLVLCSPRPTVKLTRDDSFSKWEKNIERQMNLESRKEVLLLKAALENASRKIAALERGSGEAGKKEEPFSSEIEPISTLSDDGHTEQLFIRIAEDIESEALDTTEEGDSVNDETDAIAAIKLSDPALEKELEEYRAALITSLRPEENDESRARADSITSSDDPDLAEGLSKSNSSEATCSERKMINVRMIDGENFTTEWGLDKSLPPPPDHGLRSPIVETILSKWTDDPGTRSALLGWMENILNGSNVDATPTLKLSGLDHQIRDGFMMHVLPLLLRRKDVHIHLTSRAHRQTTYDIAVTVTPTSFGAFNNEYDKVSDIGSEDPELQHRHVSRESKHHLMAFQATRSGASMNENHDAHTSPTKKPSPTKPFLGRSIPNLVSSSSNAGSICTAVTSPISNRTPSRGRQIQGRNMYTSFTSEMKRGNKSYTRNHYPVPNLRTGASPSLGDELSVGSSADEDIDSKHDQQQSSIMGSISGAFGLLSRRRPSPSRNELNHNDSHPSMFQTPQRQANRQSASKSSKEEEHPYHRVVSAPPGKIGITFVEYRGHAMVSNVSDESPLAGWVFPSDVLVAIDDTPVSGLRTKEIVRLLTNKAKRQRNLRMVSAVAMNELTRPGTV